MKYAQPDSAGPSLDCGRTPKNDANNAQTMPGTGWSSALAALVGAPVRLHRFRHLYTAVLEDAIRAYDCRRPCGKDS
jgi:hypothetical protein